jgi:hypothetical protein
MRLITFAPTALCALTALTLVTTGCATKKYLSRTIAPVQEPVANVSSEMKDNSAATADRDRTIGRVGGNADDADHQATTVGVAEDLTTQAVSDSLANRSDTGKVGRGVNDPSPIHSVLRLKNILRDTRSPSRPDVP